MELLEGPLPKARRSGPWPKMEAMQLLQRAVAEGSAVRFEVGGGATSIAELVPVQRSEGCVALGLGLGDRRYLRIVANEERGVLKVDLAGGRSGPWTEFRVTSDESANGAINLQGVKSGLWLHVVNGEFTSLREPEPLNVISCAGRIGAAEEQAGREYLALRLLGGGRALPWPVRILRRGGVVFLATSVGKNVACGAEGKMHDRGADGKWAQWMVETAAGGSRGGVAFKNVGHAKYLGFNAQGPTLVEVPALFETPTVVSDPGVSRPPVDRSVLCSSQLAHFKERGYLILKKAVPPQLIRNALRNINHLLGQPDCWEVDPNPLNAGQRTLRKGDFGLQLINESPVFWSALNVLLGAGNVKVGGKYQAALRFPQPQAVGFDVPDVKKGTEYHLDGMGQNRLCPFTLLCGVALSDQSQPNCGNLHVFPGSHLHQGLHEYYRNLIQEEGQGETDGRKPDLGASTQVLVQPGDVVLAHQLLAHSVGVNTSEHIRYQIFFRVQHQFHELNKDKIIDNPWQEFAV